MKKVIVNIYYLCSYLKQVYAFYFGIKYEIFNFFFYIGLSIDTSKIYFVDPVEDMENGIYYI